MMLSYRIDDDAPYEVTHGRGSDVLALKYEVKSSPNKKTVSSLCS